MKSIASYDIPFKLHIPSFDLYDGTTNPIDHLIHYQHKMIQHSTNDNIMCRFSTSLKPIILEWCHSTLQKSTNNFEKHEKLFIAYYIHNNTKKNTLEEKVFNLQQTDGETTKVFQDWVMSTIQLVTIISQEAKKYVASLFKNSSMPRLVTFKDFYLSYRTTLEGPYH